MPADRPHETSSSTTSEAPQSYLGQPDQLRIDFYLCLAFNLYHLGPRQEKVGAWYSTCRKGEGKIGNCCESREHSLAKKASEAMIRSIDPEARD